MELSKEAKKYFATEGRKGALKVYKKYGVEHYKKMAAKRWEKDKEDLSTEKELDK